MLFWMIATCFLPRRPKTNRKAKTAFDIKHFVGHGFVWLHKMWKSLFISIQWLLCVSPFVSLRIAAIAGLCTRKKPCSSSNSQTRGTKWLSLHISRLPFSNAVKVQPDECFIGIHIFFSCHSIITCLGSIALLAKRFKLRRLRHITYLKHTT